MPPPYKNPTCRGSYALGTACGHCERCEDERAKLRAEEKAPRRYSFIEEWEPGSKVEIVMTGEIGEPHLEAIEAFVARQRSRLVHQ